MLRLDTRLRHRIANAGSQPGRGSGLPQVRAPRPAMNDRIEASEWLPTPAR
jgi:hypothetical protein